MLIAHRGAIGGTEFTENSIQAFRRAMETPGVDGIEFDVRGHSDGVVISHDKLSDYCNVATLKELFELALEMDYRGILNIEIKEWDINSRVCALAVWYLLTMQGKAKCLITSFIHPVVYQLGQIRTLRDAGCEFGFLFASFPLNWPQYAFSRDYKWIVDHLCLPDKVLSVFSDNDNIYLYTVNDPSLVQKYRRLGLHVITDYI